MSKESDQTTTEPQSVEGVIYYSSLSLSPSVTRFLWPTCLFVFPFPPHPSPPPPPCSDFWPCNQMGCVTASQNMYKLSVSGLTTLCTTTLSTTLSLTQAKPVDLTEGCEPVGSECQRKGVGLPGGCSHPDTLSSLLLCTPGGLRGDIA